MTTRKLVGLGIALISAIGALVTSPGAGAAAATIKLVPVLTGLDTPVFVTNARDGTNRLFVVEQGGIIKVLQPGDTTPTVFLDITSEVLSGGERGLLGLAFHPQFSSNRRFFVDYTRPPDGATVIAEYQVSQGNPNLAARGDVCAVFPTVGHCASSQPGVTFTWNTTTVGNGPHTLALRATDPAGLSATVGTRTVTVSN